jgi:hypothetical protein
LHHQLLEDGVKYYGLPYPQAIRGIDAAIERAKRAPETHGEILPLSSNILPAIRTARSATARNDREIAVLRVLEALRIYGATHRGRLPEQLSDITEVPIPDDPITGRAFQYQRDGDKALLRGPTFRDVALNYEITMVPSQ